MPTEPASPAPIASPAPVAEQLTAWWLRSNGRLTASILLTGDGQRCFADGVVTAIRAQGNEIIISLDRSPSPPIP